jgi:hypothetical protein
MLKISAAIFSPPASRNKQLADEMSAKPEFRANQKRCHPERSEGSQRSVQAKIASIGKTRPFVIEVHEGTLTASETTS